MKIVFVSLLLLGLVVIFPSSAAAAPFKAHDKNPQIVAYYPDGPHGIVGDNDYHEGMDIVMETGLGAKKSEFKLEGNVVQQWFYGQAAEGPNGEFITIGKHSVFKLSKDGTCPNGWYTLEDVNTHPDRFWGDYLTTGATYCVKTNEFRVGNNQE